MGRCLGLSMPVERLQKILDKPRLLLNHASGGIPDVAHGFRALVTVNLGIFPILHLVKNFLWGLAKVLGSVSLGGVWQRFVIIPP